MTASENLAGNCARCGHVRELTPVQVEGEWWGICEECATVVAHRQAGGGR